MSFSAEALLDFLRDDAGRPMRAAELAEGLGVPADQLDAFQELLDDLTGSGLLYRVRRDRYAAPERINLAVGRLQTIRGGAAFVVTDGEDEEDVFIPPNAVGSALHRDRVVARVERRKPNKRPEGTVVRVLHRARETVVGTYHPGQNYGFVTPEDRKLERDVFVPAGLAGEAGDGDVVVVRVIDWGSPQRGPSGEVERVLGKLGDPGVDVLAILHAHELPTDFPAEVEQEATAIREAGLGAAEMAGRTDLRDTLVFTVDPADAKDHDDALSVEDLGQGRWRVGIHIADVSWYVRPGTELDAEAYERGTSVYLVDRVVPMLPHALSTDLCSLRPDVDRLAMTVLVEVDEDGRVHGHRIVRSVIRSRHKLAYEDAQAVLDGERSLGAEVDQALHGLRTLSRALRAARQERGSLDFDLPESRVILDAEGQPTDVQKVLRLEAHKLIEDFMLLANETVARAASRARIPFVYRIHERPDEERLEQLREVAGTFGHRLGGRGPVGPADLQRLLTRVQGRPESSLISTVVLRSMKQARYSVENAGHFGLAAKHYGHFTSPIRRYPDLLVHRLTVEHLLEGARAVPGEAGEALVTAARHGSERERAAVEAERDSIDLKKTEFMERHVGDAFEGTVSGVAAFGFFVLLDAFHVEGLVHVSSLDDYYVFLEDRYALVGERTRKQFRLGDRVRVRVGSVDLEQRRIEFLLEDGPGAAPSDEGGTGAGKSSGGRPRGGGRTKGNGGTKGGGSKGRGGPKRSGTKLSGGSKRSGTKGNGGTKGGGGSRSGGREGRGRS
ncbi:MAG: ribonuclease R [Gemmatimonadota bacterium]